LPTQNGDECAKLKKALLAHLDVLEVQYGELPSILATRADYSENLQHKEHLLRHAYNLADVRKDRLNQLEIAHSLAELFIEDLNDTAEGSKWLDRLRAHAEQTNDFSRKSEYEQLRKTVRELQTKVIKK